MDLLVRATSARFEVLACSETKAWIELEFDTPLLNTTEVLWYSNGIERWEHLERVEERRLELAKRPPLGWKRGYEQRVETRVNAGELRQEAHRQEAWAMGFRWQRHPHHRNYYGMVGCPHCGHDAQCVLYMYCDACDKEPHQLFEYDSVQDPVTKSDMLEDERVLVRVGLLFKSSDHSWVDQLV